MPSHSTIMKYIQKALEVSHLSTFHRQHLGSILVLGNKIVSIGFNQCKSSPVQKNYNKYRKYDRTVYHSNDDGLHSEIDCLNKASYLDLDWENCILYVGRENRNGEPRLAKPCPACLQAIKERGIKKVFYSTEEGYSFIGL